MLGNLFLTETVADAQIWTNNDVWDRWICLRIAIAKVCLPFAGNDVLNGGLLAVLIEVFDSLLRILLILEKEQRNVIRLASPLLLVSHLKSDCSRAAADLQFEMPRLLWCYSSP